MTFWDSLAFDCMVDFAMESSAGNFFGFACTFPLVIGFASTAATDDDHCLFYEVTQTNFSVTAIFELLMEEAISTFLMFVAVILN